MLRATVLPVCCSQTLQAVPERCMLVVDCSQRRAKEKPGCQAAWHLVCKLAPGQGTAREPSAGRPACLGAVAVSMSGCRSLYHSAPGPLAPRATCHTIMLRKVSASSLTVPGLTPEGAADSLPYTSSAPSTRHVASPYKMSACRQHPGRAGGGRPGSRSCRPGCPCCAEGGRGSSPRSGGAFGCRWAPRMQGSSLGRAVWGQSAPCHHPAFMVVQG